MEMEKSDVLVSVVLPTYNEVSNISQLINRISVALKDYSYEIIVVDDDSPDGTWKKACELNDKNVRVIRRIDERGLNTALRRGIHESQGKYIVWMDADQSMPPETILSLLEPLKNYGYDISLASRYVKGGKDLRPKLRLLTSKMINLTATLFLSFNLAFNVLDYTSGYVAVRREVFERLPLPNSIYGEYCIAFLYHAKKKGFKIKEVPYSFIDRLKGESKTAGNLMTLLGFGWIYFKRILKLRFGGK